MPIILYFFSFLPSLIWLLIYLREDVHPESNKMILKIFFLGFIVAAPLAVFVEYALVFFIVSMPSFLSPPFSNIFNSIIIVFFCVAFVEEYAKYLIIKWWVLKNPELDEPPDLMIYMIIAALGFAAMENLGLLFFKYNSILTLSNNHLTQALTLSIIVLSFRFVSATFLHALTSASLGYFLAISFKNLKNQKKEFIKGFIFAVCLHGIYDWVIINLGNPEIQFTILSSILLFLTIFVYLGFKKLRKIKAICLLK